MSASTIDEMLAFLDEVPPDYYGKWKAIRTILEQHRDGNFYDLEAFKQMQKTVELHAIVDFLGRVDRSLKFQELQDSRYRQAAVRVLREMGYDGE